ASRPASRTERAARVWRVGAGGSAADDDADAVAVLDAHAGVRGLRRRARVARALEHRVPRGRVRDHDLEVDEPRRAGGRAGRAAAGPGVGADVVVVAAGGEEQ